MRGTNVCIWKLEKDLDEIIPLLRENYSKTIPELADYEISEDEKTLICKWKAQGDKGFVRKTLKVSENSYHYFKAVAHIETSSLSRNEIILPSGEPIPKDIRVNQNNSRVIFVQADARTYAIISGAKSVEGKIRSHLMESRMKDSRWGRINFNNIPEYSFNKSFYYWLLKNKDKKFKIGGKEMQLIDVKGFKSSANRNAHSYNGEGSNISEEIPLKSIVSMDESLISLYVKVLYNRIIYSFYLDFDGRLLLQQTECGEFVSQNPLMLSEEKLLLTIYFDIIPFLIQQHNIAQKNGWKSEEEKFRKKSSIEVILELMQQNGVVLDDLKKPNVS